MTRAFVSPSCRPPFLGPAADAPRAAQSMNIDKSLDEIVASKKRAPRPNAARNNSRNDNAGGGRRAPAQPQAAARAPQQQQQQPRRNNNNNNNAGIPGLEGVVGDKVVISNLPTDVTEAQIKVSLPPWRVPLCACRVRARGDRELTRGDASRS